MPVARFQLGRGSGSLLGRGESPIGGLEAFFPSLDNLLNSTFVKLHLVGSGCSVKWLLRYCSSRVQCCSHLLECIIMHTKLYIGLSAWCWLGGM